MASATGTSLYPLGFLKLRVDHHPSLLEGGGGGEEEEGSGGNGGKEKENVIVVTNNKLLPGHMITCVDHMT